MQLRNEVVSESDAADFLRRGSRFKATHRGLIVTGYECVLYAPRTWSALWGIAPETISSVMGAAHDAAVTGALERVQAEASLTCRGVDGVAQITATGLLWARFEHFANSRGNPLRHTHVVVGSQVIGSDNRWGPLDSELLQSYMREQATGFDLMHQVQTQRRLAEIGHVVKYEQRPSSGDGTETTWEIAGIPDELIRD